ncbi:MAG: hypothetical protein ACI83B_001292 [Sediminicola sp.]|jgi:hypothetical protein
MKSLVVFSHRLAAVILLLLTTIALGQDSYKESFKIGKDALVEVNASYADVVFETWNKNYVEVEAYIEGKDLSNKEKKEIFEAWKFDVLGNSKKVVVSSNSGNNWNNFDSSYEFSNLESLESLESLSGLKALKSLGDINWDIAVPDVPNYDKFPKWPFSESTPNVKDTGHYNSNLHNGRSFSFDTDDYEKDKQRYVDKLNKKYDTKVSVREVDSWLEDLEEWSEGFEKVMEEWGEDFGREFELKFGPEFERKMEKWGDAFGKDMEKWGEAFGKDMEVWGENFGKEVEKWAEQFDDNDGDYSKTITTDKNGNKNISINTSKNIKNSSSKVKKKIIIRMPKGTKTDINVRHGEVKMADVYNIKATLNYTSFTANSIDGGKSLINASYAPVSVNNWIEGDLKVKYVDDCKLNTIQNINLEANSSNVNINNINKKAFLSGSFGDLTIYNVSNNFEMIDIVLENTDAKIRMPDTAFSFYFNGKKSPFSAPSSLEINKNVNGGRVVLNGFNKSKSTKSININASYSNVNLQN